MATLSFQELEFSSAGEEVSVTFLKIFAFGIEKKSLEKIGKFTVNSNSIEFKDISEKRASHKFNQLLAFSFRKLRNKINGKPAVYVHGSSGIPLIGHVAFGIVDRDTSIIEAKPITSCNLGCIYCSVDESKRPVDFVVERDYLVNELKGMVSLKNCSIEVNIGTQGEPFLYAPLVELIADIAKIPNVKTISINTNGTFLSKMMIDRLADAGLTRINLSINAVEDSKAREIAGSNRYSIDAIKKIVPYIMERMDLIIAPVWIPGINDDEIPKIIGFCTSLKKQPRLMIQNFLNYKNGRNPVKAVSWGAFEAKLKVWEKEFGIKLHYKMKEEFGITKAKVLKDPFKRGDIVKAAIIGPGRLSNESLGVAFGRSISVKGRIPEGPAKIKITRVKDHLCYGEPA